MADYSKTVCRDCGTEVVKSTSERGKQRGYKFCPECKKTLRSSDDLEVKRLKCTCCEESLDQSEEGKKERKELRRSIAEEIKENGFDPEDDGLDTRHIEVAHRTSPGLCKNCLDSGCDESEICWYRRSVTDPSECEEHSFFDRRVVAAESMGIECRWCGYVTSGGPKSSDYGPDWGEARFEALQRDGFCCQKCGMTQKEHRAEYETGLHVHHIEPYRKFDDDEKAHKLDNLVTVCESCHKDLEPLSNAEQQEIIA
ncbi:HNH endonuclease [Haloterrigena alkaliphila]|uniref:HNH endonuclease n=1 Tax=Haloterrigena alkaliphila TaxID=2816475 RepID=A0A8A2VE66_9EURY|nr:HNH endonuclease [Haloterrigena alkaliphila]QSW99791.1 HNH endonuclease [Haloterrigena alkaliphila]